MLFVLLCGVQDIYNIKRHRPSLFPTAARQATLSSCKCRDQAQWYECPVFLWRPHIYIHDNSQVIRFPKLDVRSLTGRVKTFPQRTMKFSNSARGARRDATNGRTPVLLCLALLVATGCVAAERLNSLPESEDNVKFQVYTFNTDADFNISTKLGFSAPKCSRFCYPWPADNFIDNQVPCAEHEIEGDEKWVPCLCTHRPFLRYLVACIFQKCGPAIVAAFEFGYQICADYNITFPAPPEAVVDLNITIPNDAITIPTTIPKIPFPFAKELPPAVDGGSKSDDNPPQRLNVSSTAWQGKSNLFGIWEEGSQRRVRQATIALWVAMIIGLGVGFIGL